MRKSRTKYNFRHFKLRNRVAPYISEFENYKNFIIVDKKALFKYPLHDRYILTFKQFINKLNVSELSLSQCRELKHILDLVNNYNLQISYPTLRIILKAKCNRILDRLRVSSSLISADSKLYFIVTMGYTQGYDHYRKHKSERLRGEKNPSYNHGGRLSPMSKKFIKYQTLSEEEIQCKIEECKNKIANSKNLNSSHPTRLDYWMKRGFSEEVAKKKLSERQTTFSLKKCIEKYGEKLGRSVWENRQLKWLETLDNKPQEVKDSINKLKNNGLSNLINRYGEEMGIVKFYEINHRRSKSLLANAKNKRRNYLRSDYQHYTHIVRRLTDIEFRKNYYEINPYNYPRGTEYHVDHKFSCFNGFINNIPPYIIASVVNLQMLPATYNIKKPIHNDIELDELLEAFYERY